MTDQSVGDALQEQWRNTAKDAAFGRLVKSLLQSCRNTTKLCITPEIMIAEIQAAYNRVYDEEKDNG